MKLRGRRVDLKVSRSTEVTHMERITGGAAISVPQLLTADFEVRPPRKMAIAGDFVMSRAIGRISDNFSTAARFFDDTYVYDHNRGMAARVNPNKEDMQRLEADHNDGLVAGKDLLPAEQTTEALFVDNPRGSTSPEAGIWLGRALALDNITSIYYLTESESDLSGLEQEEKVTRIGHYLDTLRLVSKSGEIELGLIEAMDMYGIDRDEAIK